MFFPRKTAFGLVFCFALLFALAGTCQAKVYKWVDDKGKVHYTDSPAKIPKGLKKKLPQREYKNTDIGWKCFVEMEPKVKQEVLKTRNNVEIWKRENVRNQKYLKDWTEKAEKFKDNPGKRKEALEAIDVTNERIVYLNDQIKLVADLRKIDKEKYKCR